jgi:hypothetical protein
VAAFCWACSPTRSVQALAIETYLFVNRLTEFYALAAIFATAYGGLMPLYAVLARGYFLRAGTGVRSSKAQLPEQRSHRERRVRPAIME